MNYYEPLPGDVKPTRCFVTRVSATNPSVNRFLATVEFQADHAYANHFLGSIEGVDGSKFAVGDVINVTIQVGDKL